MSEINKNYLEQSLHQLKCHFNWNLVKEKSSLEDLENRIKCQVKFFASESKATLYNLLAYIKHLRGQTEAALECLQQAEDSIQQENTDQAEIRRVVTWGNYAWVYYHMGRFQDAQVYLDKVETICKNFLVECPEMDSEQGWALLKFSKMHYERAKECFEKALNEKPNNPEFTLGLAITLFQLDGGKLTNAIPLLRKAIELNPNNQYVKVILALELQRVNEKTEAKELVEEALTQTPRPIEVLCKAGKFYHYMNNQDTALELLREASELSPENAYLQHQLGHYYWVKANQINKRGANEAHRNFENIEELRRRAIAHMKKAIMLFEDLTDAYSYIGQMYVQIGEYEEAEKYFQRAFSKTLTPKENQLLHLRYGNFQQYQRTSEKNAIFYYLEGLKINEESNIREKLKGKLIKIAERRFSQNPDDSVHWLILAYIHRLNGEEEKATACYKKGQGVLLENTSYDWSTLFS